MSGGEIMGALSIGASLLLGLLVFITNRRANKTSEKKVEIEAEDTIAERRRIELERLYLRVEKLEKIVEELQKRDREKQTTIDDQADELERTNEILSDVRDLFSRFVTRVEQAWTNGHTMPTLTDDERELLERTIPNRIRIKEKP